jgi:hypothetical protein
MGGTCSCITSKVEKSDVSIDSNRIKEISKVFIQQL